MKQGCRSCVGVEETEAIYMQLTKLQESVGRIEKEPEHKSRAVSCVTMEPKVKSIGEPRYISLQIFVKGPGFRYFGQGHGRCSRAEITLDPRPAPRGARAA